MVACRPKQCTYMCKHLRNTRSHLLPSWFVLEHWQHNRLHSMSKLGCTFQAFSHTECNKDWVTCVRLSNICSLLDSVSHCDDCIMLYANLVCSILNIVSRFVSGLEERQPFESDPCLQVCRVRSRQYARELSREGSQPPGTLGTPEGMGFCNYS